MLYLELLTVLLLILMNGLLAMSELAVVSSRKSRLDHLANQGSGGACAALRLLDDPSRFLSTVQIGITWVGIIAGDLPERGKDDGLQIAQKDDGSWLAGGTVPTGEIEAITGIYMGENNV